MTKHLHSNTSCKSLMTHKSFIMTSMGCERLFILWPPDGVTEQQGPDSGWKLPLNSHLEPLDY